MKLENVIIPLCVRGFASEIDLFDVELRTHSGMMTFSSFMTTRWPGAMAYRLDLISLSCHEPSTSLETRLNTR